MKIPQFQSWKATSVLTAVVVGQRASVCCSKFKSTMLLKIMALIGLFIPACFATAAIVTNGFIKIAGIAPAGQFALAGTDFTAIGGFSGGNWLTGQICTGPCATDVDGGVVGNDFGRGGSAFVSGAIYGGLNWGDINGVGGSFFELTGPSIALNAGSGTYTGNFSFSGKLCGTAASALVPNPCVAGLPSLTGSGTVALNVAARDIAPGRTVYSVKDATYSFFEPPVATDPAVASDPVSAPEINASSGTQALALLLGVMFWTAEARRRRS